MNRNINNQELQLKSIESELKSRLDVLNTNNISLEKMAWENVITDFEKPLLAAYKFLNSLSLNHPGLTQEQYLAHCLRVSTLAIIFSKIEKKKVALISLLHNIYEVSNVESEEVIKHFGLEVSEGLSKLKVNRKLQSDPIYMKKYYLDIVNSNSYLKNVKILDKFDNLFMLGLNSNNSVRKKYLEEIKEYILPFSREMDENLAIYIEKLIVFNEKKGHFTKQITL